MPCRSLLFKSDPKGCGVARIGVDRDVHIDVDWIDAVWAVCFLIANGMWVVRSVLLPSRMSCDSGR